MKNDTDSPTIFISSPRGGDALAREIASALNDADIQTSVSERATESGTNWVESIRERLGGCDAVVALGTPASASSAWQAMETGAAIAWQKPVFVVLSGIAAEELAAPLAQFQAFAITELEDLAGRVRASLSRFTPEQRGELARIYHEVGVPADQLVTNPASLDEIAHKYNRRYRANVGGQRLLQELIRLRKQGLLRKPTRAR